MRVMHNHAKYKVTSSLPGLRVIDCSDPSSLVIKVVEDLALDYLTLSYVWGTDSQHPAACNAMPEQLPRTIRDAIEVVKKLGYQYLWVDRYCVPQEDCRERHAIIQGMDQIYENSVLSITAAAGGNSHYGLPGAKNTPRKPQLIVQLGSYTVTEIHLYKVPENINASKWNSRGWTYQEALLSRRRLVFTDKSVYYQCGGMHCLEELSLPLLALHTANKQWMQSFRIPAVFPLGEVGHTPFDLDKRINEYLHRELTYDSDVLKAFQGILRQFEQMKPTVMNLCGLPIYLPRCFTPRLESETHRLLLSLSWRAYGSRVRRTGFPSWTWAGWK